MNFFISRKNLTIYGLLFLAAIIAGIIVGYKVNDGWIGLYTTLAIATLGVMPFVKKMILYLGRKAVDFATTLDLILVMTILFAGIYYKLVSYWWFVLVAFLFLVIMALKNYVLYLIVDIRDSLHRIAYSKLAPKREQNVGIEILKEDEKKCPYCGKAIKIAAKKCRFCNNWLTEEGNSGEK